MNHLKRLRVFVWVVLVLGVAQAIGAAAVAASRDDPASGPVQLAVAVGVALVGASALGARRRMLDRPWRADTPEEVVYAYVGRLVVQVVLALGSATVAYAGALVTGGAWLVAIGLVLLVLPLAQAMPTDKHLARIQAWLSSHGVTHDLAAALRAPGPGTTGGTV